MLLTIIYGSMLSLVCPCLFLLQNGLLATFIGLDGCNSKFIMNTFYQTIRQPVIVYDILDFVPSQCLKIF